MKCPWLTEVWKAVLSSRNFDLQSKEFLQIFPQLNDKGGLAPFFNGIGVDALGAFSFCYSCINELLAGGCRVAVGEGHCGELNVVHVLQHDICQKIAIHREVQTMGVGRHFFHQSLSEGILQL